MKRTVQTTSQTREPVGPALVAMATAMQALAAKKLAELAQRLEPQKPPSMLERLGDKRKTLLAAATGVDEGVGGDPPKPPPPRHASHDWVTSLAPGARRRADRRCVARAFGAQPGDRYSGFRTCEAQPVQAWRLLLRTCSVDPRMPGVSYTPDAALVFVRPLAASPAVRGCQTRLFPAASNQRRARACPLSSSVTCLHHEWAARMVNPHKAMCASTVRGSCYSCSSWTSALGFLACVFFFPFICAPLQSAYVDDADKCKVPAPWKTA